MSTNFYLVTDEGKRHIGKRCAAGRYCHKCSQTLCEGGEAAIHTGRSPFQVHCPKCDEAVTDTTCSFTWAMEPHKLAFVLHHGEDIEITDEYGSVYDTSDFNYVLRDQCRIQFYDSIGTEFC